MNLKMPSLTIKHLRMLRFMGRIAEGRLATAAFPRSWECNQLLLSPIRTPVRKPVHEPNRCILEPFKPETSRRALYLVLALGRLTL